MRSQPDPARPAPASVVVRLLRAVCARHVADAIVGDVLEELAARVESGRAPRWPGVWLNVNVLSRLAGMIVVAAPRALRSLRHAVRDAWRALQRSPGHALFIFGILAVGISAATVTFSVVDGVVLKPLPFDRDEELVVIGGRDGSRLTGLSAQELDAIRDRVPGLEGVGTGGTEYGADVNVDNATEYGLVSRVSADYLRVLRLRPLLGRLWTREDEARHDTDTAVLGYELWQHRFNGDPQAIGRTLFIDKHRYQIIGVMPAAAGATDATRIIAAWVPSPEAFTDRTSARSLTALGRLRPGVSTTQLTAQITSALAPLAADQPSAYAAWHPRVEPLLEIYTANVRSWMALLAGTVGLVVLIACVNAANLMLTRAADRAHDFAIRASLGASRRWLASTLLVESLMLSCAAGAATLLLSWWGISGVKHVLPPLFRSTSIALDGRVFVVSALSALLTGVLFGVVPAWQASRTSVVDLLKDATASSSTRRRWRSAFLVAEVASIGVLLIVCTLFIGSFIRVTSLDLGFDRANLLTVSTLVDYQGTVQDVEQRLAQIPGIAGVAAVRNSMPPLVGRAYGGAWDNSAMRRAGERDSIDLDLYRVTPNYFSVADTPFRRGSTWQSDDPAIHPIVIDDKVARHLFPGQDPLGQLVVVDEMEGQTFTVVGVVAQAFPQGPEVDRPAAYYAMPPNYKPSWVGFVLRTSVPPESIVHAVEMSLAEIAPPPHTPSGQGVHVVNDAFQRLTAVRRFNAWLMSVFAAVAMLIGAAGIYAVMASVVAQQTHDIGVRVALGATTGRISRSVLAVAGRHIALGLVIGLPLGWWISRGFASLFFQVGPGSPLIYVIVAVALASVGLLAAIVPARRAARVDPIISLRAS
jgi:predicted permease